MTTLYLVYRRRLLHRRSLPDQPSDIQVICGAFWDEGQVKELAMAARQLGYELFSEEVPVRSQHSTDTPPDTVFVLFDTEWEQNNPEALEFADPVGQAVYFTRDEVDAVVCDSTHWFWEDVWELPVPWVSHFALHPFTKIRSRDSPEDYEFSF